MASLHPNRRLRLEEEVEAEVEAAAEQARLDSHGVRREKQSCCDQSILSRRSPNADLSIGHVCVTMTNIFLIKMH